MHSPSPENPASLSKLRIEHNQRPTAGGRVLWLLSGIVIVVLALAGGAGWWYYRTTGVNIAAALTQRPISVNVVVVPARADHSEPIALVATGKIVSDRLVNVATKVSGQITELNVEQGDRVEQDQVLARVEDVIYRAQRDEAAARVAQTEHDIARAHAERLRAEAAITQARADFEYRQRDYQRLRELYNGGQASELEYLNAKNLYEAATAGVSIAEAAAESAAAAVQMTASQRTATQSILAVTQKRLDDCAIRAPIAGVILERNSQVGDFLAAEGGRGANANAQLVSIADMTLLRVEVDVSERDVRRIFAGQPARITPDADADSYEGRVMWVDPVGDYARATVQVKVRIINPGAKLRVQGSAKVEFFSAASNAPATAATTLWLPKAAVQLTPGSDDALVFTVTDDRAIAHPIKIGTRTDKQVEVRSGVAPNMQLICENLENIVDGSRVRVVRTVPMGDL